MKKVYFFLAVLLLAGSAVSAQINLTNASPTISENFDGIGTSATATLPSNWRASKSATQRQVTAYSAAVTATEQVAGNSMAAAATNGIYNYGAGVAASATDRAVGGISSGSASKSVNVYTFMSNAGTTSITDFTISYKAEKYRDGTNTAGFSIQMYYSTDGSTWTSAGASFLSTFAGADATNNGYASAPGATLNVSSANLPVSVTVGNSLYLAWNYSVTTGTTTSNAQALGVDDVVITANFSSASTGLSTVTAGTPSAPATLSSLVNTSGAGSTNFSFLVTDDGSSNDANPTKMSQIIIGQGSNNHASLANWTQAILGAELSDGTVTVTGTVNATNITFAGLADANPGDIGYVADNGNKNYTLKIWLRPALGGTLPLNIDGKQFDFVIQTSGITTESTGSSGIAASQSVSAGLNTNVVTVVATQLAYVQNTTTPTGLNTAMSPAVTVSANDANSNRDLDFTSNIRITSTGTLSGTPVDVAAVSGLATFSTLTHTVVGTGLTLNAERTATLDWDIISNPFDIAIASAATDYFRSITSGDWSSTTTWESSSDNASWIPATLVPDFNANTITIRNGHTVAATTAITADQVEIENGGILSNTAGAFTVNNGTGDDVNIQSGGIFTIASAGGPVLNASATVNVGTNGIVRVSRTGYTNNGTGINATGFVYQHSSILEYTLTSAFSASGVTFFPNVNATTIPIFRTTAVITSVGGGSATVINGIFEANGNITFTGAGTKTFRNGITGSGNVVGTASGKFIINGATAILGGAGLLTLPATDGLDVGTPTIVTLTSSKVASGNIHLLTSSYIELGANDLTLLGDVTGGSATSYIRTNGAGVLNLQNITALKTFPIGNSKYNPVTINNVTGYDWRVKVDDFLNVTDPVYVANVDRSVLRTWTITPSVNPPATASDVTFQYNDGDATQIGPLFNTGLDVQVWHTGGSVWSSAGSLQTPTGAPGSDRTATLSAWSAFSKFAISNAGAILPISISYFKGFKQNNNHNLDWKVNCSSSPFVTLTLERSTVANGGFAAIHSLQASATRCNQPFAYTDAQPLPGMNYYRLKMADANGGVTYSGVVALLNKDKGFEVTGIAPNPVTDGQLKFNVSAAKAGTMDMVITDMQGRLISRSMVSLAAGFNAIPVDASKLASGTYYIYGATEDGKSKPVRFVKQ